jgi:hypothetical protein
MEHPDQPPDIVCRVTPWYYRRVGAATALVAVFGAYFLYDWKFGYPKANQIAERKEWFENELVPSYEAAREAGRLEQWQEEARREGWSAGREGDPPKWLLYSAERGWPEKPKRYTGKEVEEQYWWGVSMLGLALALGVNLLRNVGRIQRGDAVSFTTPDGRRVLFDRVRQVDILRWRTKGLATVRY